MESDVIIVGAGAAGLMAARELARSGKTIIVLEARERFGGRIRTFQDASFSQPVETGAEFVHGNLELTLQLLQEAGLEKDIAEGDVWRNKNGHLLKQDDFIEHGDVLLQALQQQERESSIGLFLETHFSDARYEGLRKSVQDYVEGYYAGTLQKASTLALKEEWQREEEPQYRVVEGYTKLMQTLYDACVNRGCAFRFSSPVKQVTWTFKKVAVTTANGDTYRAKKIIMAVPLPVLTSREEASSISFYPELSKQKEAFTKLGSGSVIKILIQFETAFWKDEFSLNRLHFLFSDEVVPTWWTQHPRQSTLLTGWCAGPHADSLKGETDAQLIQKAIQSLAHIFGMPVRDVDKRATAWKVCNWAADPYTLGGYSYITTTTKEALQIVADSVEQTIYFAGEAFYDDINVGTVEAALQSGRQTAQQVRASFS